VELASTKYSMQTSGTILSILVARYTNQAQ
jgi:hypothetical protein